MNGCATYVLIGSTIIAASATNFSISHKMLLKDVFSDVSSRIFFNLVFSLQYGNCDFNTNFHLPQAQLVCHNGFTMSYFIAGLGNPGEEYENTRHNIGRIVLESFRVKNNFSEWKEDKKNKSLISDGKMGKSKVVLVEPNNFMNNSGKSLLKFITSAKKAENLIVVYDDIDLPLGVLKISFNRGSGGHRGLESVIKSVKTKKFIRLRVGVSPVTPSGKIKKPKGEQKVLNFLMGDFKPKEKEVLKKILKNTTEALEMIVLDGKEKAAGRFN